MNTFQAIETHFVGPTNHRGSRIIATSASGHKLTYHWEYSLGIDANHYAAAQALCNQLDWGTIKAGGTTKRGMVWVMSVLEPEA